jgi:hypothetical protein
MAAQEKGTTHMPVLAREEAVTEAPVAILTRQFDFWANRQPCWEKCHCPEDIRTECPATTYRFLPCWQIEGTYCKLDDSSTRGDDISICQVCRVYKKYGNGEPIEIKLMGKGMNVPSFT